MVPKKRIAITSVFLAIMLCASLASVNSALADDGIPTEPATATETETAIETPDPAGESSVEPTPAPTDAIPTPEPVEQTSPEEVSEEEKTLIELLSEVSENTDLVVLDENGEALSLASQAAAESIQLADPIWCPEGQAPTIGLNDCTNSFASIFDLLNDMNANPGNYAENGIIYLEISQPAVPTSFITSAVVIDNSTYSNLYTNLNAYNLTIQGGWNTASGAITGQTNFTNGAYLQIGSSANPWAGNVTIRDIEIVGAAAANGLTVYTTGGDISLSDVDLRAQEGDTYSAYLESETGDITVDGSLFDGRNSPGHESQGFHAQINTGSITIADTIFQDSLGTGATNFNGATLSAPIVSLANVVAQDNDGHGVAISNADLVTLDNVTGGPTLGGTSPGNGLSGVLVVGTGATVVNVNGGIFTFNGHYGIELHDSVLNELSAPTCFNNGLGTVANPCYSVTPAGTPTGTPTETPTETPTDTPTNTPVPTTTPSPSDNSGGSGGGIPLPNAESIDLGCLTTINLSGITITFFNLCDYQTQLNSVDTVKLPGPLPVGTSLLMGLDVLVLDHGQYLESLPDGTGIQMDFPLPAASQGQFAVLYWEDQDGDGEWIEVTQRIIEDEVAAALTADPVDELYLITTTDAQSNLYKILTTEKPGIFVLVTK